MLLEQAIQRTQRWSTDDRPNIVSACAFMAAMLFLNLMTVGFAIEGVSGISIPVSRLGLILTVVFLFIANLLYALHLRSVGLAEHKFRLFFTYVTTSIGLFVAGAIFLFSASAK